MENEVKKSASKVWLIPTIVAAVLLIGLVVFMVIMGKGTSALADGTVTLSEAVSPLQDGTAQLSDGVDQYTGGVDTMNEAMPTLQDGVKQYTEGVDQLNGYMKKLNAATPTLANGVAALNKGVNGEGDNLSNGMQTLTSGLDSLNSAVNGSQATSLSNGAKSLAGGSAAVAENVAKMNALVAANATNMATTESGLTGNAFANVAGDDEVNLFQTALAIVTRVNPTTDTAIQSAMAKLMNESTMSVGVAEVAGLDADQRAFIMAGAKMTLPADKYTLLDGAMRSYVASYATEAPTWPVYITNATNIATYVGGYKQGLAGLGMLAALTSDTPDDQLLPDQSNWTLYDAAKAVADGASAINSGVNGVDPTGKNPGLGQAIKMLAEGAGKLNAGVNGKDGLAEGVKALNAGVNGKDGLVASVKQLYKDGSNKLAENSDALRDGVKQLADGAKQLSENSQALRDGASQLKDAAPALIDGIGQLVDGAKKVNGFTPIH